MLDAIGGHMGHNIPTDTEPSSMYPYLHLVSDATTKFNAVSLAVPAEAQTLDYALAVLDKWGEPPGVAQIRAQNRIGRTDALVAGGVRMTALTTEAGITNLHVVGGNRGALVGQLLHLERLVQADIRAGDASGLHIGIVPAEIFPVIPDQIPPGLSYISPNDVGIIETATGAFILGPEAYTVDAMEVQGPRSEVVNQRRQYVGKWMGQAATGADALVIVQRSLAALAA